MATATAKKKTKKKATKKATKKALAKKSEKVESTKKKSADLFDIQLTTFSVTIESTSPMIMNRWTQKARDQMIAKMEGTKKSTKREPLDKEQEFLSRFYMFKGKPKTKGCVYGVPAIWIKQAIIDACGFTGRQIFKTTARGAVMVEGTTVRGEPWDLIPITNHTEPWLREDHVRNATGVADLRFRPQFDEWDLTFDITCDASILTPEQILNLLNRAGFSIGLGEYRPSRNGDFGRYQVVTS